MLKVFFQDKFLILHSEAEPAEVADCTLFKEDLSRAKVLNLFEKFNSISVECDSVDDTFRIFAQEFRVVFAAGCLVKNESGESLMICSRNRWDLPKGHVEEGESDQACAVREVEEETGVGNISIKGHICNTWHIYNTYGPWELKRTAWFLGEAPAQQPVPQSEEGISAVEWCNKEKRNTLMNSTYPTIREVIKLADNL